MQVSIKSNLILKQTVSKPKKAKKIGLSQDELAQKLGVTFQAVSKWENAKAAPDITFLPIMADIFGCYIDELFSREIKTEIHYDHCSEFPWADDNTIRIFQTVGKKIIKSQETNTCIEVAFPRNCNETTRQYFKVEVFGNLMSDSSINGDIICHGRIDCHEINGDVTSQGDVSAYQINSHGIITSNKIINKNN